MCEDTACTVNKRQEIEGTVYRGNSRYVRYSSPANIIINTSCEHVTQEQYEQWLSNQPDDAIFVIQSNNYFDLPEHIRCATDADDFMRMSKVKPLWRGEFETPMYTRYMIIGKKK